MLLFSKRPISLQDLCFFVYSIGMTPNEAEKTESEETEKGSWKEDIEKLDYYYDDSTGYEIYVDEESEAEPDSDD